jgi:hypothetical protein
LQLKRDGGSTACIAMQRRINQASASKVTTVGPARIHAYVLLLRWHSQRWSASNDIRGAQFGAA